jgi:isoleucyl-tRNA synthetase
MRKELDLDLEERIRVWIETDEEIAEAVEEHSEYVRGETRADELHVNEGWPEDVDLEREWEVEDRMIRIAVVVSG